MSTQPEALQFADDRPDHTSDDLHQWSIDAETLIRRLHAANIDCLEHFNAIKAERDELLQALKAFPGVEHILPFKNLCNCGQCEFIRLRRAVIAKAGA
jgi:hypothetical protein